MMHFNRDTRCEHYYYQGEKSWKKLFPFPSGLPILLFLNRRYTYILGFSLLITPQG